MAVDTSVPEVPEFRHILVAGDSSPSAKRAVAVAARLASQAGAKLTILHVMRKMQVPEELLDMADVEKIVGVRGDLLVYVGNKILRAAQEMPNDTFIVATDSGIFSTLRRKAPGKRFIEAPTAGQGATCRSCAHCPWMAMNELDVLADSLRNGSPEVRVDPELARRAMVPLQRMLDFSGS